MTDLIEAKDHRRRLKENLGKICVREEAIAVANPHKQVLYLGSPFSSALSVEGLKLRLVKVNAVHTTE